MKKYLRNSLLELAFLFVILAGSCAIGKDYAVEIFEGGTSSVLVHLGVLYFVLSFFTGWIDNFATIIINMLVGLSIFLLGFAWQEYGLFAALMTLGFYLTTIGFVTHSINSQWAMRLFYCGIPLVLIFYPLKTFTMPQNPKDEEDKIKVANRTFWDEEEVLKEEDDPSMPHGLGWEYDYENEKWIAPDNSELAEYHVQLEKEQLERKLKRATIELIAAHASIVIDLCKSNIVADSPPIIIQAHEYTGKTGNRLKRKRLSHYNLISGGHQVLRAKVEGHKVQAIVITQSDLDKRRIKKKSDLKFFESLVKDEGKIERIYIYNGGSYRKNRKYHIVGIKDDCCYWSKRKTQLIDPDKIIIGQPFPNWNVEIQKVLKHIGDLNYIRKQNND